MNKSKLALALRLVGGIGTVAYLYVYFRTISFPTPDKILALLVLVGLAYGQAWEVLKRFVPFVGMLFIYESFRGIADKLNTHVNFMFMYRFDLWLFRSYPTAVLQDIMWQGKVQWYDFMFYFVYALHFVMPFMLAVFVWKKATRYYWQYVTSFVTLSFAGFLTYLLYPAAPPWMSSDMHLTEPVVRVSSHVWWAVGIKDFPTIYHKLSPNAVAAVPSLHAAYSILFALSAYKIFGKKWGRIALIYPTIMCFGIVYMGEHYVFDLVLGAAYAFGAFYLAERIFRKALSRS